MKSFFVGVLLLFLPTVFCPSAFPQATSRVTGTVTDPSGAVIQGASVSLMNAATNVIVSTVTTSTGAYVFDGIIPGTYFLTISAPGFATYTISGNVVTIAAPMVVNASLKVGNSSEKISVVAATELVQTENAGDLGALVDQRALETLPVVGSRGRSPLDLLEVTIPGVVDGGPLNSSGANIAGGGVAVNPAIAPGTIPWMVLTSMKPALLAPISLLFARIRTPSRASASSLAMPAPNSVSLAVLK